MRRTRVGIVAIAVGVEATGCGDLDPEVERVSSVSSTTICVERTNGLWMAEDIRCFPRALYDGSTELGSGQCLLVKRAPEAATVLSAVDAGCPADAPATTKPRP